MNAATRLRARRLAAVLTLGAAALCSTAHAQSADATARAAARSLGTAGVHAFQAGEYPVANEKLERAYAVMRVPSLGLWSARTLVKLGKLIEAAERYTEVTRLSVVGGDAAVQKKAQQDAQTELEATQALIPTVLIRVQNADAVSITLTIDGVSVSSQMIGEATPVNPGRHHIEAVSGKRKATTDITSTERQQEEAVLVFSKEGAPAVGEATPPEASAASVEATPNAPPGESSSSSPRSPQRLVGFVALGVGGAGLVLGGITGVVALSKKSDLDKNPQCADDHRCPASANSEVSSYNTMRTVSSVGFIAGGVLAATGLVLVLTAPHQESTVSFMVSPSSVAFRGQF